MEKSLTRRRTAVLLAALVVLAGTAPGFTDSTTTRPMSRLGQAGVYAGEGAASLFGGLLLGVGSGALVNTAVGRNGGMFTYYGVPVLVAAGAGYSAGAGLGAWGVGSLARQRGRVLPAIIGGAAGTALWSGMTLVLYGLNARPSTPFLIVTGLTFTPLGAVIGYNLGRPRAAAAAEARILLPAVGIRYDAAGTVGTARADLRLVTIRF